MAAQHAPLWKRLGWMALIWFLSVLALGVVAGLLRLVLAGHGG
ncbi:MAG: DUF2474 domain-containing protein [Nitratireductor sp.]|nr:DUF2474 domain-containing protein [Nitratireductor sp.]